MKISVKTQYGLQAMLELAFRFGGAPVQIRHIAGNQKIPVRFLEQLMLLLKRGGVVVSTRGMHGGYTLAKHPSDINLLEIFERLEGPLELTSKKMKRILAIYEFFEGLQNEIKATLSKMTLEDLVFRMRQVERAYVYNI